MALGPGLVLAEVVGSRVLSTVAVAPPSLFAIPALPDDAAHHAHLAGEVWAGETSTLFCGGWRRFFFVRRAGPSPVHVSVGPRTDKGKSVTGPAASRHRRDAILDCPASLA